MIDEKQLACWADEVVFAVGDWLKPIDAAESEAALSSAVKASGTKSGAAPAATFL
jgi:hypothetical protein